jgi:hypothetical protein
MGAGRRFGDSQFIEADVRRAVNQLMQSGATTRDVRGGLSDMALGAERQLGLMNAPQVLGQISGAGNTMAAEQYKKLMAEAVSSGLNLSGMPKEMEKFTQTAAMIATRGGGFSQTRLERFGSMMGGEANRESIQAAAAATQMYEQSGRTMGGIEGQIGYGFLLSQKRLQGAMGEEAGAKAFGAIRGNAQLATTLNAMSASELDQDPAMRKGLAQQLGVSEDDLMRMVRSKDQAKQTRSRELENAMKEFGQGIQGLTGKDLETQLQTPETARQYSELQQGLMGTLGQRFQQLTPSQRRAYTIGVARNEFGAGEQGLDQFMGQVEGALGEKKGRAVDVTEGAMATGDARKLQNLSKYITDIEQSAEKYSNSMNKNSQVFEKLIDYLSSANTQLEGFDNTLKQILTSLRETQ